MNWTYLFFSFDGRINRKPYWIGTIALICGEIVCYLIADYFEQSRTFDIIGLAFLYPEFAVIIKRAHDRETPYWIPISYLVLSVLLSALSVFGIDGTIDNPSVVYWIVLVPLLLVSLYLMIDLGFRTGTPGPNRYGADPLERRT